MVSYAGKPEKPFWFSSLDQKVHFGAIIKCRSFKNYSGQFVWIEKKRKATIIVGFHFMKRRLKRRYVNLYQILFYLIIKLMSCIRFNKLASKYFWKLSLISFLIHFFTFPLIFSSRNIIPNERFWLVFNVLHNFSQTC